MKNVSSVAAVYYRRWIFVFAVFTAFLPLRAQTNSLVPFSTNAVNVPIHTGKINIDPFSDPLIKSVQARHDKAVAGDKKETQALTSDLEKWTKEQPNNHLLQAYLGSVYTLDCRDAWPGPGKLTYLQNGGKELDAAVLAAPNNPAVRFIRAVDYFELPAIFGKRQTARDDFATLLKEVNGEIKTPYILDIETQQAIYYYAGLSFRQMSQPEAAKKVWTQGQALNPTSALGVKMSTELAKLD
jgi:hypothetical protein